MIKNFFILLIKFYQSVISPVLPPSCRYEPSCSHYAISVIREWGAIKGTYLTIRRILRCHPWSVGGYDPPPVKNNFASER